MQSKRAVHYSIMGVMSLFCAGSAHAQMCSAFPPKPPHLIYENRLTSEANYFITEPLWNTGWSWPAGTSFADAGPTGSKYLVINYPVALAGAEFHKNYGQQSVPPLPGGLLVFSVKKTQSGGDVIVGVRKASTGTVDQTRGVSEYVGTYGANTWHHVAIPLSDLGAGNVAIEGVTFQYTIPGTVHLDDVGIMEGFKVPLDCSNASCSGAGLVDYRANGAFTGSSVTSVMDHSMKLNPSVSQYPYGEDSTSLDGIVHSWTDEEGQGAPVNPYCYPKVGGGSFSIAGTYVGTPGDGCTPSGGLNYDDHPGYDYKAVIGTPVKAAAAGTVVTSNLGERCFKNNLPGNCNDWGAVGINHGNGYISQYLHMSTISVKKGDAITAGQVIGMSGDKARPPATVGPHLHFEVLKRIPGSAGTSITDYKMVDPYGWTGSCQGDPLYTITGVCNFRLWK